MYFNIGIFLYRKRLTRNMIRAILRLALFRAVLSVTGRPFYSLSDCSTGKASELIPR